ncbi:hypothetical protein WMY93_021751 [Mugilogobius chulae]|uniref:Immediate early response 3-interacting protein 1 n=1 Tax=Mugilogobius chulae TaxID=88201 RepID=A0AAW0NP13_9GOBI
MAFTLYTLIQTAILCTNAIAVLHEERFLSKVGWGVDQGVGGFGDDPGVKAQILNLIRSVRTVMRVPLIIVNSVSIVLLLLFDMSSTSQETFLCSICLEVFSEPVTTPCGHNFCKLCICEVWNTDGPCTCPLCNRSYNTRPVLSVNTLLRELVSERKLEKNKSGSIENMITAVQCDVCSGPKLKALKSCLHKNHELLSLEEGCERRRSTLQYMVEQKIQEIQGCLEFSDSEFHRERTAGQQAFTALIQFVQRHQEIFSIIFVLSVMLTKEPPPSVTLLLSCLLLVICTRSIICWFGDGESAEKGMAADPENLQI